MSPLLGIGTSLPSRMIAQEDAAVIAQRLAADAAHARLLPALYRRSAVARRGSVLLKEPGGDQDSTQEFFSPPRDPSDRGPGTRARLERYLPEAAALAVASARAALGDARLHAGQITHLITVSCTGFAAPGVDAAMIASLGLRPTVARTSVGFMGCHGAINGLRIAQAFAHDPAARVLLTAVELCSLHFQYGRNPEQAVANALFADGAASVVLGPAVEPARDDARSRWSLSATGSCLLPDSSDAMSWHIGDHGFEMSLSPRVPSIIQANLRPWIHAWLDAQGSRVADIGSWAIHPGGPRVLSTVAECLAAPAPAWAASREVLEQCGNMSSATVLFIVDRLRRAGAPLPCVALAFGPGLVIEAALFRAAPA